jgi:hypothetical protein
LITMINSIKNLSDLKKEKKKKAKLILHILVRNAK